MKHKQPAVSLPVMALFLVATALFVALLAFQKYNDYKTEKEIAAAAAEFEKALRILAPIQQKAADRRTLLKPKAPSAPRDACSDRMGAAGQSNKNCAIGRESGQPAPD